MKNTPAGVIAPLVVGFRIGPEPCNLWDRLSKDN